MTREEIIRLAREAGLALVYSEQDEDGWRELERFAALVAAAEREACAKLAENEYRDFPPFCGVDGGEIVANDIAAEIRARGKQE